MWVAITVRLSCLCVQLLLLDWECGGHWGIYDLTGSTAPPTPPSLLTTNPLQLPCSLHTLLSHTTFTPPTLQPPLLTPLPLHASPNTTFTPHNPFNLHCSLPQLLPHHLHSSPLTHQLPLLLPHHLHSTLPSSKSTPHSSTHSSPPSITLPLSAYPFLTSTHLDVSPLSN